jgi:beta-N-acetylhexosaminidase
LRLPVLIAAALALGLSTVHAGARPRGDEPAIDQALARVGSLVIVGFAGTRPGDPGVEVVARALRAGRIGGVILFDENIVSRRQLSALTAHLRAAVPKDRPAIIAIDEEGGGVQRLTAAKGFASEPSAMRMARSRTPVEARAIYTAMARDLAALGVTLNLAPVVDLDVNRSNTVISKARRSFGADPAAVEAYARAFVAAHREAGVLTAIKHWPGHGSSKGDTHLAAVDVTLTHGEREHRPFAALVASGDADAIMIGHLGHARFDGTGKTPASLSPAAVAALRRDTGFEGPVITDDLAMSAVSRHYALGEAAVLALAAGNDLVLVGPPGSVTGSDAARRVHAALVEAVLSGRLTPARIGQSHRTVRAFVAADNNR